MPMPMRTEGRYLAEMNVIPFVDVALVLLIIFMVTAPMLYRGLDVTLPESKTDSEYKPEDPFVISIERNNAMFIDDDEITKEELRIRLRHEKQKNSNVAAVLRADQTVPYGTVIEIMDEVRQSGILRIGMATREKRSSVLLE